MATTTFFARAPGAPRHQAVPVDEPDDAEFLARNGLWVTAETTA